MILPLAVFTLNLVANIHLPSDSLGRGSVTGA